MVKRAAARGYRVKAFLIDDHELFRAGLRLVLEDHLEFTETFDAGSLDEGLEMLAREGPADLIVTDLNMPGSSGPESVRALIEAFPEARVVVISASEAASDILACISCGVDGYIPKSMSAPDMVAALRQVLSGSVYVPRAAGRRAAPEESRPHKPALPGIEHLTDRQKEVLDELLTGKSSKEIARVLNVAEGTVKIHLAAIYRALGVRSRAEAIARLVSR